MDVSPRTGSDLPKGYRGEDNWGTYSTKKGFPTDLPPSATLLKIANVVGMKFELQQVICDTLDS